VGALASLLEISISSAPKPPNSRLTSCGRRPRGGGWVKRPTALRVWQTCAAIASVAFCCSLAAAQSSFDATTTVFYEKGGPLKMTVLNPAVKANAQVVEALSLHASWEADVVSGASVAVVDAPGGSSVDAVTSATTLEDFRQVARGGAMLRSDVARLDVSYGYGFEKDYKSHALAMNAATDLFDRNTTLEVSYARGWDSVCDLSQPQAEKAVERQRMPSSQGCFKSGRGRTTRALDRHLVQGAWTQAWTSIFNTQLVLSSELLHGLQANPYRAVWLGRAAVQEHHPNERARYALGIGARLWLRPIGGALQAQARGYRDTWGVQAASVELAYERGLGQLVRIRVRGRYYQQGAAAFFSDDYALDPQGQYFTGDRELSAMRSWLGGAQIALTPRPGESGKVLRVLDSFRFVLKGDYLTYQFTNFHYGAAAVPNRRAIFGTLGIDATF
jgi:hypothetical protein